MARARSHAARSENTGSARSSGARLPQAPERGGAGSGSRGYAEAALLLAGHVLASADTEVERDLACVLLRESLLATACALRPGHSIDSLEAALAVLAARPELARVVDDARSDLVRAALGYAAPSNALDLRAVEVLLGAVLARIGAAPVAPRAVLRRRRPWLALAAFALIVALVVASSFTRGPRSDSYRWSASSAIAGFGRSGTLAHHGIGDLVFHTQNQYRPWVVIDMLQSRPIDRMLIENRRDCCSERGLPLVVEIGEDQASFREVGRRTTVFDTWELKFPARQARFVRIRSQAFTMLHLRGVQLP